MELSLYYVTNRGHQGKKQFKPESYGIHPSKSGIENLRLGKVTVDAGVDSFDKWFQEKTGAGTGDGVELSEYLKDRAEEHGDIIAYQEKIPDKQRVEVKQIGIKLGSQEMFKDVQDAMPSFEHLPASLADQALIRYASRI